MAAELDLERVLDSLRPVESSNDPSAISRDADGNPIAYGPYQLKPSTAAMYGLTNIDDLHDEAKSRNAARQHLQYLHGKFGNWDQAITAYNAGEGTVENLMRVHGPNWHSNLGPQAKAYMGKVMAHYDAPGAPAAGAPAKDPLTISIATGYGDERDNAQAAPVNAPDQIPTGPQEEDANWGPLGKFARRATQGAFWPIDIPLSLGHLMGETPSGYDMAPPGGADLSGASPAPRTLSSLMTGEDFVDTPAPQVGPRVADYLGLPKAEGDSFTERAGDVFGGMVTGGLPGFVRGAGKEAAKIGLRGLPAVLPAAGRTALEAGKASLKTAAIVPTATAAGIGAEDAGRYVGGDTGGMLARIIAEGLVPSAVGGGATGLIASKLHKWGSRPETAEWAGALDRLGVDYSGGLIGSKQLASVENSARIFPFSGSKIDDAQQAQIDALEQTLTDAATDTRSRMRLPNGRTALVVQPDSQRRAMGQQVHNIAKQSLTDIDRNIEMAENELSRHMSAGGAVDVRETRRFLESKLRPGAVHDPRVAAIYKEQLDLLDYIAEPISKNRDTRLRRELAQAQHQLANAQPQTMMGQPVSGTGNAALVKQLETKIAGIEKRIKDNTGANYEKFRKQRTDIGRHTQGDKPSMTRDEADRMYGPYADDLRYHANARNIAPQYDELMAWEKEVFNRKLPLREGGDVPYMEKLRKMNTEQAMNHLASADQSPEIFQQIRDNASPRAWSRLQGDILENMGRGADGLFSPGVFSKRWEGYSDASKDLLIQDPQIRRRIDDIAKGAEAFVARGKAGNPSGTARTAANYAGMVTAVAQPGVIPYMLEGIGGGYAVVAGLLSKEFAKLVANKPKGWHERLFPDANNFVAQSAGGLSQNLREAALPEYDPVSTQVTPVPDYDLDEYERIPDPNKPAAKKAEEEELEE